MTESMELTRRQAGADAQPADALAPLEIEVTPTKVYFSFSQLQLCIFVSVVLDFAGCIFSTIGLSMAGSGLYQGACRSEGVDGWKNARPGVLRGAWTDHCCISNSHCAVVYSSVICWSALMSRCILKKRVSKEEWMGIALVTFGLAFSALGGSSDGRTLLRYALPAPKTAQKA